MRYKLFVGPKVRALRLRRGWRLETCARELGISVSYLSQIEANQRPVTDRVLMGLIETFEAPAEMFEADDGQRLVADLREAVADTGEPVPLSELRQLAQQPEQLSSLWPVEETATTPAPHPADKPGPDSAAPSVPAPPDDPSQRAVPKTEDPAAPATRQPPEHLQERLSTARSSFRQKAAIMQATADEVHHTPKPTLEAAQQLGLLIELEEQYPAHAATFSDFYRTCAFDNEVITVIRAQCLDRHFKLGQLDEAAKAKLLGEFPSELVRLFEALQ